MHKINMDGFIFEKAIGDLLITSDNIHLIPSKKGTIVDYVIIDDSQKTTAIEVKLKVDNTLILGLVIDYISKIYKKIDEFVLVTYHSPKETLKIKFYIETKKFPITCKWLSYLEFIEYYKISKYKTIESSQTISNLQLAALTKNIQSYDISKTLIDAPPITVKKKSPQHSGKTGVKYHDNMMSQEILSLRRQLSLKQLVKLNNKHQQGQKLSALLKVGKHQKDCVIVLSDIMNFSQIVSVSNPEIIQEQMNKYYRDARDLVWKYGGTLDKFIGDAVLAIFGYPFKSAKSPENALQFSMELVALGKQILPTLQYRYEITTGTRVGITTGSVYVLNIGDGFYELSFISDDINLAARLESNCERDCVLIENKLILEAKQQKKSIINKIPLTKRPLSNLQGQPATVIAWQTDKLTK